MSSNYEVPVEVRELEKKLNDFSYHKGYDISQVFDDFLRYIIWAFSLDGKPIENWKYPKEQNLFFYELLQEWVMIMQKQIKYNEWYDAFGELYMACIASPSRAKGTGQFFTPPEVCDLMTMINTTPEGSGGCCSDPTCGSGRTLISWHVKHLGYYLCAEDLDQTCCLMCACNFIIHGCVGEVIWHNSLQPETFFHGWKINECLTATGIPTIRSIEKEESKVWQNWESKRLENETKKVEPQKKIINPKQESGNLTVTSNNSRTIQLSLFD